MSPVSSSAADTAMRMILYIYIYYIFFQCIIQKLASSSCKWWLQMDTMVSLPSFGVKDLIDPGCGFWWGCRMHQEHASSAIIVRCCNSFVIYNSSIFMYCCLSFPWKAKRFQQTVENLIPFQLSLDCILIASWFIIILIQKGNTAHWTYKEQTYKVECIRIYKRLQEAKRFYKRDPLRSIHQFKTQHHRIKKRKDTK